MPQGKSGILSSLQVERTMTVRAEEKRRVLIYTCTLSRAGQSSSCSRGKGKNEKKGEEEEEKQENEEKERDGGGARSGN